MALRDFAKPKIGRVSTIGLVLRILLALVFLGAGMAKLSGQPMMIIQFDTIGLGQWLRYFTGGGEVIGALLLLIPRTTPFGALMLCCIAIGAFITQLTILKQDIVHTIVLAILLAFIAWIERRKLEIGSRPENV